MTRVLLWFTAAFALLILVVRLLYGGGNRYVDVTTAPLLPAGTLEVALSYRFGLPDDATPGR